MKKMMKPIAIILSVMVILFGCSSEKNQSSGNEPVTLEFMSMKGENRNTYNNLIEQFEEENPGININLRTPPEAETTLRTGLTKNNAPDVIGFNGNSTYGEIAEAGVLYDFSGTGLVNETKQEYVDMLDRLSSPEQEGVHGIPYAVNANVVIYNKNKVKELGIEIPDTWSELIEALETAEEAGEIPIQFTLLDPWTALPAWNALAANLVPENFGELKDDEEVTFAETHGEVADKMTKLLEYGSNDNFGKGYDDGNRDFASGEGVFYFQINSAIPEILRINPEMELGVFPLPATNTPENNDLVSGVDVALSISKASEHKEEALRFIEYLTQEETAEQYIEEQETFTAVKNVNQDSRIYRGVEENFAENQIVSFQDHYYPIALDTENIIQSYLLNQNKEAFLQEMDEEWTKVENR